MCEVRKGAQIIGEVALAEFGAQPVAFGDLRLELEDLPSFHDGSLVARQGEHSLEMRAVLVADFLEFGVLVQIVVAIGKPEAALSDAGEVAIRVLGIRTDPYSDGRFQVEVRSAHEDRDVLVRMRRGDGVKCRLCRLQSRRIDDAFIQVSTVVVADFLLDAARGRVSWQALNQFAHTLVGFLGKLVKGAPPGTIRRNLLRIQPTTIRVAVEIVSRLDGLVLRREIEAKRAEWSPRWTGGLNAGSGHDEGNEEAE